MDRFHVTTEHGDRETLYHVIDRHPRPGQPQTIATYTTRTNANAHNCARYRAECANGRGFKGKRQQPGNARFWNWCPGGWVKITLRPGQELSYAVHQRTEEGWSAQGETFRHDGDRVTCEWWNDGADCDGRLSREGECSCPLDRLAVEVRSSSEDRETRDILAPAWERGTAEQRDYQAEAANY